jgi:hypothetical protein
MSLGVKINKGNKKNFTGSLKLVPCPILLLKNPICHTERRKTKRESMKAVFITLWVNGGGGRGVELMSTTAKSVAIFFIYLFIFREMLSSSQVRDLQSANARMTRHVQYVEVSQRKEIENIKAGLAQPMRTMHINCP